VRDLLIRANDLLEGAKHLAEAPIACAIGDRFGARMMHLATQMIGRAE
jgi:hypothetical protein